jgi:hypothetical protein
VYHNDLILSFVDFIWKVYNSCMYLLHAVSNLYHTIPLVVYKWFMERQYCHASYIKDLQILIKSILSLYIIRLDRCFV